MSFSELTDRLEESFRNSASTMRSMLASLQARRVAWGSARPSTIAPPPELEQLAQGLAREEHVRSVLLDEIRQRLPAPIGGTSSSLHVNVTRIAAVLPPQAATSLREAADEAVQLAKAVRIEVALGQRLLQFSRRAHEGLLTNLGLPVKGPRGASTYDRRARPAGSAASRPAQGQLVDGRM
jgi:hypothetical protein